MAKTKGRPSKIDKELMKKSDIVLVIIIIILFILLSVSFLSFISPEIYDNIRASIVNLLK